MRLLLALLLLPGLVFGATSVTTSGTSSSITWTFSEDETVGQYANGDWWVVAPVTIISITPDATGGSNGWMVNPSGVENAYDSSLTGYDVSLMPALPYAASAGDSIVKAVDRGVGGNIICPQDGDHQCLDFAAVLTVVGSAPAANSFRPPYWGTEKTTYNVSDLQTQLLPSLASPGGSPPTLQQIEDRYRHVQLESAHNTYGLRGFPPTENFKAAWSSGASEYGAEIARDYTVSVLRLFLNDSVAQKEQALINLVQAGIDYAYISKAGEKWGAEAGHFLGRKLPIVFAAVMLDDQTLKTMVQTKSGRNLNPSGALSHTYNNWSEDGQIYYSTSANNGNGQVLWGERGFFWSPSAYDAWFNSGSVGGSRTHADDHLQIDGGAPHRLNANYQFCCSSKPYVDMTAAITIMPELRTVWGNEDFITYADRWHDVGFWTQPDSQSRVLSAPAHNTSANGGFYGTTFASEMYDAYRDGSTPAPPPAVAAPSISPAGGQFTSAQSVSITAASGTIYYTLDGTTPTTADPAYSSPITITGNTTVCAVAYDNPDTSSSTCVDFVFGDFILNQGGPWANIPITCGNPCNVTFDITPSGTQPDIVVGFTDRTASTYDDLAAIIRASIDEVFDARNGSSYEADAVFSYVVGTEYTSRISIDLTAGNYDGWIRQGNGAEVKIADNYAFRTTGPSLTEINNIGIYNTSGAAIVSNITVEAAQAGQPDIEFSDTPDGGTFGFGTVLVSASAPTMTQAINNFGQASLTGLSCSAQSPFTVTSAPASTIAASGSSSIVVTGDNSTPGNYSTSLICNSNDPDENPYSITLTMSVPAQASGVSADVIGGPGGFDCGGGITATSAGACP